MSIPHILTEVFNTPQFITQSKFAAILGVLDKKAGGSLNITLQELFPQMAEDKTGEAQALAPRAANSSGDRKQIAVIPVLGTLTYRNGGTPGVGSGTRSYRNIQSEIERCLNSKEVDAMLLDCNSYGGSARGCETMARYIREADSKKPIYAYVDLNAFSAGYYLAAACRKIILADKDAGVGSIGCIAVHYDKSMRNEKEGDVYTATFFGSRKNDFSPNSPLSKEMFGEMEASVNSFGMTFAETMAEFRNLPLQNILNTQAGVFHGEEAIQAGLADHIAPLNEALAMLAAEVDQEDEKTIFGGNHMSLTTQQRMEKLLTADDGQDAIKALGFLPKSDLEGVQESLKADLEKANEALRAQKEMTLQLTELCEKSGLSLKQTRAVLNEADSMEAGAEAIQTLKAHRSQMQSIKSTITNFADGEKHPLIAKSEEQSASA